MAKLTLWKRGILKFASLLMVAYTFTTSIILIHKVLFSETNNQDPRDTVRTFMMLYVVCLCPAFVPMSFIMAFRGEQICPIINQITQFQPTISGS